MAEQHKHEKHRPVLGGTNVPLAAPAWFVEMQQRTLEAMQRAQHRPLPVA